MLADLRVPNNARGYIPSRCTETRRLTVILLGALNLTSIISVAAGDALWLFPVLVAVGPDGVAPEYVSRRPGLARAERSSAGLSGATLAHS